MHRVIDQPLKALACVFIFLFIVNCGESPEDSGPLPLPGDNQNQLDPSADDCPTGQNLNPFTGQCVDEIDEEQDPGPHNQNSQNSDPNQDNENSVNDDDPCGFGSIHGQACGTNGAHLPAAQVTVTGVDCYGQPFYRETTTDGNGEFYFDNIPAGHHEMFVQSGSFSSERNLSVRDGVVTSLMSDAEKVCISGDVNIMIMQGSWDDVGGLLDNLELEYDTITSIPAGIAFFDDPARLSTYDIIFIECWYRLSSLRSQAGADFERLMMNLRNFVLQGGSLYTSDRTSNFMEATFPEIATFNSGAASSGTYRGEVMSTSMQTLLGDNEIDIRFDTSWNYALEVDPQVQVHFQGPVPGRTGTFPWMFSYTDPINGGTLVYTSFHNDPDITPEMEQVLEFLIFQL